MSILGRSQVLILSAWSCGVLLWPGVALALGLGEARVNSYLNQPLDAHIRLIDADADALDSLAVRPGSADDYRRVGLDLSVLQTPLNVTVDRSVDPPVVHVTSRDAITDPVLQILVYARWNSGRVLREYTLFLDPPLIDVAPSVARSEPESPPPAPRERPAQSPAADAAPASRPVPGAAGHVVQAGDTLWSIAYQWRPDSGLNMNQVMLAFQQLNPHAFVDGNVNHMQRGVALQFPDADDIRAIDVRRAEREIQAQMQAWHSRAAGDLPVLADSAVEDVEGEAPDAMAPVAEAPAIEEVRARLSLVPPDASETAAGDPLGDPEAEAETRRLRGVLAQTDEEMEGYSFEHREVGIRANALRDGIEARELGLGITDSELAELEDALRAARLDAAEQAALARRETADDIIAAHFGEFDFGAGVGPANSESVPGVTPAVVADTADQSEPEMHAAEEIGAADVPAEASISGWLLWGLIVAALAVALAAVFWVSRRRQPAPLALDEVDKIEPEDQRVEAALGTLAGLTAADVELEKDPPSADEMDDDEAVLLRMLADDDDDDAPAAEPVTPTEAAGTGGDEPDDDIFTLDESEAGVKLDLAQAYLSMGDREAARILLSEVIGEGSAEQQEHARRMLSAL